ncbi:MAG TPA: SRPBCC domain-containing protein [Steroidobacteraceae bacterium]|jgi:uncharacterized protein YndB with AHSA1/START domain
MKSTPGTIPALCAVAALLFVGRADADAQTLVTESIINAPVAEVWRLFTTSAGLESWMAPHADIDLKVAGLMRVNYEANGTLDDDATVVREILSFEPERMLSFRAHRTAKDSGYLTEGMWWVIYFQPLEPGGMTNVRIVTLGYPDAAKWAEAKEFYRKDSADTLEQLQARFRPLCPRCEREKAEAAGKH